MTVLLVDDDPASRLVASMALEDVGGFEVIESETGNDGLEQAARTHPDVILLDLVMPDLDGQEVFRRLQFNEATKQIPVIFFTAKSDPADVRRLLGLGAKGVIVKPFDPMTLAEEVQRILDL